MSVWRRHDRDESRLVAECEAFLAGSLAEMLSALDGRVPAWAWLNLLAHGTSDDLLDAGTTAGPLGTQRWSDARTYLAGEVLGRAEQGPATLEELQRQVLVPLELQFASAGLPTASPGDLRVVGARRARRTRSGRAAPAAAPGRRRRPVTGRLIS